MRLISDYHHYILYSIPYLVAAYVLIRAKVKAVREARALAEEEASQLAWEAEEPDVGPQPANMPHGPGGRRFTALLNRVMSRRAA